MPSESGTPVPGSTLTRLTLKFEVGRPRIHSKFQPSAERVSERDLYRHLEPA